MFWQIHFAARNGAAESVLIAEPKGEQMPGRSFRLIMASACTAALLGAGSTVGAQPTPTPSAQSKTQLLIEIQKRLDSPDPAIRYPAYDAALSSDDAVIRNLALAKGMASSDSAVRSMALASIFSRLKSLSVEVVPNEVVTKEIEAAKQGGQSLSREASLTLGFLNQFGNVITVNVLAYDAKSQSFIGVVPDHIEAQRIKNKDYSVGSLSGEVLQLSAKLHAQGYYYENGVVCQMSLALKQGGIMSGPLACTGNYALPRATGRLKVF